MTGTALLTACGHSAFDPLPSSEQAVTNDGGVVSEGGTPPPDGGTLIDAGDGGYTDAGREDASPPLPDGGSGSGDVYVSAQAGNDVTGTGTMGAPFLTIMKGINRAQEIGSHDVRIADGMYSEDVTVQDRVSLHGGYVCNRKTCDWTADGANAPRATSITSTHSVGMVVPADVTRGTVIENLSISSFGGPIDPTGTLADAAVTITGAPTLSDCTLLATTAGMNAPARSAGLVIAGGGASGEGAHVENCTISSADASTSSVGILFGGVGTPNARIEESVISSGAATQSVGVLANAAANAQLVHNTITSGRSTGDSDSGFSWGVMANSPLDIERNSINVVPASGTNIATVACATTSTFCGGISMTATSARIVNNWVSGIPARRTAALLINVPPTGVVPSGGVVVDSNTLLGGGVGLNDTVSAAIVLSNTTNAPAGAPPVGIASVTNNILVAGSNSARFDIYEDPQASTARCTTLATNDFVVSMNVAGGASILYHVWDPAKGATDITSLAGLSDSTQLPSPSGFKNISADPRLIGDVITSSSPCFNQGLPNVNLPPLDIAGTKRPQGASNDIGAFEVPVGQP